MAEKRVPYNWENVQAGDIISFKYKSKNSRRTKLQTILVLNPTLRRRTKKGSGVVLIGIKLEEANRTQLRVTKKQLTIFEQIGDFVPIDSENNLYKLSIFSQFIVNDIRGIKPRAFDLLSKGLGITGAYRTYDYVKARRSACYLEPIRLFTKLEQKTDNKPQQPKKPKGGVDSED
jgi:hypothetical protein|tara:strand:+ start:1110 stop:1634 length:525 start_codon:yes stop_codon:yes gene_type:complete